MRDGEHVPWTRLRGYFLDLASCRSCREMLHAACVELQRIIPYDETAGIFFTANSFNVEGFGKEACTAAFNTYWRKLLPRNLPPVFDWRNLQEAFAVDFVLPNGMCKNLRCQKDGYPLFLTVNRSRLSPGYRDTDVQTIETIHAFVNDLYGAFNKLESAGETGLPADVIRERFGALSLREAEVCSMVARRLSTAEIAAGLFISPRTVEKHVEHIFGKLGVCSRGQLRGRLGAQAC